jgi:hypothetical protein
MANFIQVQSNNGVGMVFNEDAISVVKDIGEGVLLYFIGGGELELSINNGYGAGFVYDMKNRYLGARAGF